MIKVTARILYALAVLLSGAATAFAADPFATPEPPFLAGRGLKAVTVGSGFFVDHAGALLTGHHVVASCAALSVEPAAGGAPVAASLVAAEPANDLALLRSDITANQALLALADPPLDGQEALVLGYPNQGLPRLTPFLTEAHLTGPRAGHRFRFDGDIRPGNSGGPILDRRGQLVGMVFGKIDTVQVYQATGRHEDKIGFAIDSNAIADFVRGQGIIPPTAPPPPLQEPAALFAALKPALARVLCWKAAG